MASGSARKYASCSSSWRCPLISSSSLRNDAVNQKGARIEHNNTWVHWVSMGSSGSSIFLVVHFFSVSISAFIIRSTQCILVTVAASVLLTTPTVVRLAVLLVVVVVAAVVALLSLAVVVVAPLP